MRKLKLTYFDFHGGRGEPARLAMFIGEIEFEDRRVPFSEWPAVKAETLFHALPVLKVDGKSVTQSNAINRYVGKLAGLYPSDSWQAALCDEVMDAVEDITHKIAATFTIEKDDEKRSARQALADGPLRFYLERLQTRLEQTGGEYFADNRLTVADLKVFVWIRHLRSGKLDYIPVDLSDRVAPLLVEHFERLNNHPKIAAYYKNR
ncbi:MAG: glutathione S-transferase [Gammaproteobacteria bacterium]|nr:glutathione S-transferase [Gammaproteobacteria bacterium]